jgi:penicillin amidase
VAAGAVSWAYWRVQRSLPELAGELPLRGLAGRVEVLRDVRGVPHIRAESLDDLIFAQGFVTAQDRMWQMDLSRRLARGELSEIFGEVALAGDIESRTLGFPRVMDRAVGELDEESRRLFEVYARGVNAYLESHRGRLPVEFLLLGYEPALWQPADSIGVAMNMAKALSTTWPYDLMRERIRAKLSSDLYADLFPERSSLDRPIAQPVALPAPVAAPRSGVERAEGIVLEPSLRWIAALANPVPGFSNNWVVSGARTKTGKPLLANDPHLWHGIPSVWYMVHLQGPDMNVTGVTLPGLPAVTIGHNDKIGWGVTNTGPDVQDLYAENFNFRDPRKYLFEGQWLDAEFREEIIKVKNADDYRLTVKSTRRGPVVSRDGNRDLTLRWTALEPGGARFAFFRINRARNWDEFRAALRDFPGPMQNFVYADVEGNIGYYAAAEVPIRRRGDGTVPARGFTADFDWTGMIPFEHLPQSFNPPGGILSTANNRVVPEDYPYLITRMWMEPYRVARIFELLEQGSALAVEDMLRIQTDIYALEDVRLIQHLLVAAERRPPDSNDLRWAVELLKTWDGQALADSPAPLICQYLRQDFLERLLQPKLSENLSGYEWFMSSVFLEKVLEERPARWLPPGDADFDETLMKSLREALLKIGEVTGIRDRRDWRWGDAIAVTFQHPLGRANPFLGRLLNVGPFAQSGTRTTVKSTLPGHGPSMRMVVDFADLDRSVLNITLGQSGNRFSPHYRDQVEAWLEGRSFPMPFSDAAVNAGTVNRLVLVPER